MASDSRVWLITGASSGFGRSIAEAVIARGDSVAPAARNTDSVADLGDGERDNHGSQPGDPEKAAAAIIAALDADEPPLRLVLGADAIGNVESRLGDVSAELAAWRAVGEATAIDEQPAA